MTWRNAKPPRANVYVNKRHLNYFRGFGIIAVCVCVCVCVCEGELLIADGKVSQCCRNPGAVAIRQMFTHSVLWLN